MEKTWTWAFIGSAAKFDADRIIEICQASGVRSLEYGVGGAGYSSPKPGTFAVLPGK